ncbi:MAG: hypothetical protein PHI97_06670 [Desulfobulbus sp.]|nr:hypothetical protein [Desulfobulbus sp.]
MQHSVAGKKEGDQRCSGRKNNYPVTLGIILPVWALKYEGKGLVGKTGQNEGNGKKGENCFGCDSSRAMGKKGAKHQW